MTTFARLVAQATRPAESADRLWHTVGTVLLLVVVAVTLTLLALWVKRQFLGGPEPTPPGQFGGFNLADLRRLRAAGKMTEAEFERAKALLVAPARKETIARAGDEREGDTRTKDVDLIREAEEGR